MKTFFLKWAVGTAFMAVGLWLILGALCFLVWSTEAIRDFYPGLLRGTAVFSIFGGLWMAAHDD